MVPTLPALGSAEEGLKSYTGGHFEHDTSLCKCKGKFWVKILMFYTQPSLANLLYISYMSRVSIHSPITIHYTSDSVWADCTKFAKVSLGLVFPELRIINLHSVFLNKTFHTTCLPGVSGVFPLLSPEWDTVRTGGCLLIKPLISPQQGPNTAWCPSHWSIYDNQIICIIERFNIAPGLSHHNNKYQAFIKQRCRMAEKSFGSAWRLE